MLSAIRKNNDSTIKLWSTENLIILNRTKILITSWHGATVALVLQLRYSRIPFISRLPVIHDFPETFSHHLHISPPQCISNKFLHHHCHVDRAKEADMFIVQSALKITPCAIVLQRKAIVCPWEAPESQGLSADASVRPNHFLPKLMLSCSTSLY